MASVLEVEHPAVFQELVYHAGYPNGLRQARNPRPQAAGSPDDQLDGSRRRGGAVRASMTVGSTNGFILR